jgi:uncharacterized damage-inducible protein DinB
MSINTLRELFSYDRWANDSVLDIAAGLTDEQLDRSFDMGFGTLRETLRHIYGAGRIWHERVGGLDHAKLPQSRDLSPVGDIHTWAGRLSDARACWLESLDDAAVTRQVDFVGSDGKQHSSRLADILLQVVNHGIHHRAQVLNMFRGLGAPLPRHGADYIFMYVEDPERPAPVLDADAIRRYSAYSSWAFEQALDAAAGLTAGQLDRDFEMGLGTLRKTLIHIHDAESWWQHNWRDGPVQMFPAVDVSLSPARLREMFAQTAKGRDEYIAARTAAGLLLPTTALVRQGRKRSFPLGVTMLQLCCHGTHHRAQAVNMLRRLGVTTPKLDLLIWARTA